LGLSTAILAGNGMRSAVGGLNRRRGAHRSRPGCDGRRRGLVGALAAIEAEVLKRGRRETGAVIRASDVTRRRGFLPGSVHPDELGTAFTDSAAHGITSTNPIGTTGSFH